jgi:hypothetical protein
MVSLKAQLPDRRGSILEQSRLELRIYPCTRDDLTTALGSNFLRINVNPGIDGLGINQAFLDKQAFQGLHPKRGL